MVVWDGRLNSLFPKHLSINFFVNVHKKNAIFDAKIDFFML